VDADGRGPSRRSLLSIGPSNREVEEFPVGKITESPLRKKYSVVCREGRLGIVIGKLGIRDYPFEEHGDVCGVGYNDCTRGTSWADLQTVGKSWSHSAGDATGRFRVIKIVAFIADPGIYSWGHELYRESWGCDLRCEPQVALGGIPPGLVVYCVARLALARVLGVVSSCEGERQGGGGCPLDRFPISVRGHAEIRPRWRSTLHLRGRVCRCDTTH